MITAKIKYEGDLRTTCTHVRSGQTIITDAPVDNNGKGEAFSPTDLFSTSLVSCMFTIMGIAAQNKNIDFAGAEAEMQKIMAEDPRRVAEIIIKVKMPANNYTDKEKSILEHAAHHCPVMKSISPDIKVQITFEYQ